MGFPTTVGGVSIRWFDTISLDSVLVKDSLDEPLFQADHVHLQFDRQSLTNPGTFVLGNATLYHPQMHTVIQKGEVPNVTKWV